MYCTLISGIGCLFSCRTYPVIVSISSLIVAWQNRSTVIYCCSGNMCWFCNY